MIDLTPLDVRKKRGDFTKSLRGYDTQQVDSFLELAAERLEELVKENLTLTERVDRLSAQVEAQSGREKAVNDALVTAQQLREEIQESAKREAELLRRESRAEVEEMMREAEKESARKLGEIDRKVAEQQQVLQQLERSRARFLSSYRQMLEREMDRVTVQEQVEPSGNTPVDLDLRGGRQHQEDPVVSPESLAPDAELDPDADVHRLASSVREEEAETAEGDAPEEASQED